MNKRLFLLGIVVLGSGAAVAASACSSSDVTPAAGENDSGAAGNDGGTDTGTTTTEGGTDDSGFSQLDSGQQDAGQCANESLFTAGFKASCSTCLADKCCTQVKACEDVPDCKAFEQCYAGCKLDGGSQSACTSTCIVGKDGGAIQNVNNALVLCGGSNCHNDGGPSVPQCPY